MKKTKLMGTVNLPNQINTEYIINPSMYELQGKRIEVEKMIDDPDYQYIDNFVYYKEKEKWIIKKSTNKLLDKIVKQMKKGELEKGLCDGAMWRKEWLSNVLWE